MSLLIASPIFVDGAPPPVMTLNREKRLEARHLFGDRPYPAFPNASGLVTRTGLPSRKASAFSTLCG